MPTFIVWKTLELEIEIEAATAQEARDKMLEMDDTTFTVTDCDHGVRDLDGNDLDTDSH